MKECMLVQKTSFIYSAFKRGGGEFSPYHGRIMYINIILTTTVPSFSLSLSMIYSLSIYLFHHLAKRGFQ